MRAAPKFVSMDAARVLDAIRRDPRYRDQMVHEETFPPRPARYADPAWPLADPLVHALKERGVTRLFTHQAAALDAIRDGGSVIVTTSTASGKTLCYLLPVLETLVRDPEARALFVYPTKALAQDQADAIGEFASLIPGLIYGTYDGDTPANERRRLRQAGRILLTNPDMLHVGILPQHFRWWRPFLKSLRYVVLDDMHVYRGVFGSHVGLVLRRLWRACRVHGSDPQVICTSATIANPEEFANRLTGRPLRLVDDDGAPRGPRRFVLWNPPVVARREMRRRSPYTEAAWLLASLARQAARTIVFTKARKITELVYKYATDALSDAPALASQLSPYRAGYLAKDRRAIEQRLFRGELLGVVSTSALELGIDVGALDAAVLVGYPGTMASVWQRTGRAGRGTGDALSVLIGLEDALDQYLMRRPAYFFGRPVEHATVDPDNPYILAAHLRCAAAELALDPRDETLFGPRMAEVATALEGLGEFVRRRGKWHPRMRAYPARQVDIRAASGDTYRIVEANSRRLIGTVDASRAFEQVHPGAIYLHQGDAYRVLRLDFETRHALVERDDGGYYTEARVLTHLAIEGERASRPLGASGVVACFGDVRVTQQVIEYRRKQLASETVLAVHPLEMPEEELRTTALWLVLPPALAAGIQDRALDLPGGIHAVEHAAIGILPLFAMCDRWDIGGLSTNFHPQTGRPTIFIYDGHPGGVGITLQGFRNFDLLVEDAHRLISECPCEAGCPSCVQSPKCGNLNEPLDKSGALRLLERMLSAA